MSVRINWRMTTADDRPEHPAPAAGQADAAENDRGDAQSACTRRARGVPMPVLAVSDESGECSEQAGRGRTRMTFVRPTGTPLRNAASRLLPIA